MHTVAYCHLFGCHHRALSTISRRPLVQCLADSASFGQPTRLNAPCALQNGWHTAWTSTLGCSAIVYCTAKQSTPTATSVFKRILEYDSGCKKVWLVVVPLVTCEESPTTHCRAERTRARRFQVRAYGRVVQKERCINLFCSPARRRTKE